MQQFFKKIILQGESQNMEFKSSLSLRNEIGNTISAFANTKEGIILIGVSDAGKTIGADVGKKTLENLANWVKENTDPKIYPDLKVHRLNGKSIIELKVKQSNEQPVFFKTHAFQRVGKTNQRLSASRIRELAKQEKPKLHWDEQACENASFKDIDEGRVRKFLRTAKTKRDIDINPEILLKEALFKLKVLRSGKPTNACILMFGKDPQKFFIQDEVKCARFKGTTTKHFIDMKEFPGPADQQVDDAEKFVLKNISKAAWIEPGKIQRQEKWEYPVSAIREAITNAVVHRDYQSPSKVQIRIFDDKIEIWNPGTLPEGWTVETLKQEHESKPFNPLLARMFFLIKYIEEWGRGTTEMIRECLKHDLPEPEFKDTGTSMVVVLRKTRFTEEYLKTARLNDRQLKAVIYLMENKTITRSKYESLFGCSKKTAYNDLQDFLKKKVVKSRGKGKNIYYEIAS